MSNKQIRTLFSKRRRKGDVQNLANKFAGTYSRPHISNVLAGRRNNETILNAAYKVVARRKSTVAA